MQIQTYTSTHTHLEQPLIFNEACLICQVKKQTTASLIFSSDWCQFNNRKSVICQCVWIERRLWMMKASVKWAFNGHWTAWQANYLQFLSKLRIAALELKKVKEENNQLYLQQDWKSDQRCATESWNLWKSCKIARLTRLSWSVQSFPLDRIREWWCENYQTFQLWSAHESWVTIISARDASASEKAAPDLLAINIVTP